MPISFGDRHNFYKVYHFNSSTLTTDSADLNQSLSSDVFANALSVVPDDCICFGSFDYNGNGDRGYIARRLSVRMDIVQPAIAGKFDVVWEYSVYNDETNAQEWWPLDIHTDTFSSAGVAFAASGIGEVEWNLPLNICSMTNTDMPGGNIYYTTWVRCRVTYVSALTQQPAWGNQVPDGKINAITCASYAAGSEVHYSDLWDFVLSNDIKNKRDIQGTATSGTTTTLTDSTKSWFVNASDKEYEHRGKICMFTSGANAGLYRRILTNDATTLVFSSALPVAVDNTTQYTIIQPLVMDVHDKFRGGVGNSSVNQMRPYFYWLDCGVMLRDAFIEEPRMGTVAFYGGTVLADAGGLTRSGIKSGYDLGGGRSKWGTTVSVLRRSHYSTSFMMYSEKNKCYNRVYRDLISSNITEGGTGYRNNVSFSDWGGVGGVHIGCYYEGARSRALRSNLDMHDVTVGTGGSNCVEPPLGTLSNVTLQDALTGARTKSGVSDRHIYADIADITVRPVQGWNSSATNTPDYNLGYFIDCKWSKLPLTGDLWGGGNNNNTQGFYIGFTRQWQAVDIDGNPVIANFHVIDEQGIVRVNRNANQDGYINSEEGNCDNTSTTTLLVDPSKSWTANEWITRKVLITNDDDERNLKFVAIVKSNDATSLTIFPSLPVTPNSNTRFVIVPYFLEGQYQTPDDVQTVRTSYQDHVITVTANGFEPVKFFERINYISPGGQIVMKRKQSYNFDNAIG